MTTTRSPRDWGNRAAPFTFEHGLWKRYTVFDGLAGMRVEDICQDRQGFVWIATSDGGVSRFDGEHFDNVGVTDGLPHHAVMGVTQAEDEAMWFATMGAGLGRRDEAGVWRVFTTRDGLPSDEVLGVETTADGCVRVFTRAGLCRVEPTAVTEAITVVGKRPCGPVRGAAQDGEGTTWLATRDHGVVSVEGERLLDRAWLDLHDAPVPRRVWAVCTDAEGCLWLAAHYIAPGCWVYRYEPGEGRLQALRVDVGEANRTTEYGVRQVRKDRRGWVWALHASAVAHTPEGWRELRMPAEVIGAYGLVTSFEDREGNVWLGTWGSGVAVCDPESVQRYTTADGLADNAVNDMARDGDGRLWVATNGGLTCIDGDGRAGPPPRGRREWPEGPAFAVCRQGSKVWAGFRGAQVARWDGDEVEVVRLCEAEDEVVALCVDRDDGMWASVLRRCWGRIEAGRLIEGPRADCVAAMAPEGEGLWLGARGFSPALQHWDGEVLRPMADGAWAPAVYYVHTILRDSAGTLWAGTDCGLMVRRQSGWQRLSVDDGLSQNTVHALAETPQGKGLWIGTSGGGVCFYDGSAVRTVWLGDGVEENVVTAVEVAPDGAVWLGTRAGVAVYRPGDCPPSVVVREVTAGRRWREPRRVRVSAADREVRVVCQGIGYRSRGRQMTYSFRLARHGQVRGAWTAFRPEREVSYGDLRPGDYLFEVRAMDRDGCVSSAARLEVEVTPDPREERIDALEQMLAGSPEEVVAVSPAMRAVLGDVESIAGAPMEMTVLIQGETGTGKQVVARLLHAWGAGLDGPFVEVNCGAIPAGLIEAELFGHERGAFTGAEARRVGKLELAEGGTVFLDEVGEIPPEQQATLLKVLDQRTFGRVGGNEVVRLAARVVAATNRDLERAVEAGRFRADLWYRLKACTIRLPPLRERQEDVLPLVEAVLDRAARAQGKAVTGVSVQAERVLAQYGWPGNVRELENAVQRAVLLCRTRQLMPEDLPEEVRDGDSGDGLRPGLPLHEELERLEREGIVAALEACGWRVYGRRGAAAALGLNPERLRSRMRKLEVSRED